MGRGYDVLGLQHTHRGPRGASTAAFQSRPVCCQSGHGTPFSERDQAARTWGKIPRGVTEESGPVAGVQAGSGPCEQIGGSHVFVWALVSAGLVSDKDAGNQKESRGCARKSASGGIFRVGRIRELLGTGRRVGRGEGGRAGMSWDGRFPIWTWLRRLGAIIYYFRKFGLRV